MRFGEFRKTSLTESKTQQVELVENLGSLSGLSSILTTQDAKRMLFSKYSGRPLGPKSPVIEVGVVDTSKETAYNKDLPDAEREAWNKIREATYTKLERTLKNASRAEEDGNKAVLIAVTDPNGKPAFILVRSSATGGYNPGDPSKMWKVFGIEGQKIIESKKGFWDRREAKRAQKYKIPYNGSMKIERIDQKFLKDWNYMILEVMISEPGLWKVTAVFQDQVAQALQNERAAARKVGKNGDVVADSRAALKLAQPYYDRIVKASTSHITNVLNHAYQMVEKDVVASNTIPNGFGRNGLGMGNPLDADKLQRLLSQWLEIASNYSKLQTAQKGSYQYENSLKWLKMAKTQFEELISGSES